MNLLRGNRADEGARLRGARREQDERWQRDGYVGSHVQLATAVWRMMRARGYSPGMAEYGAQMASLGHRYNWQGQFRLAQLTGVSRRSTQRYRARMQDDGLLTSNVLLPGDMLDDMRAPVTRKHVVRDIQALIDEARAELAPGRRRRGPQRKRGDRMQKQKRPRPQRPTPVERTAAAQPPSDDPVTAEQIREFMLSSLGSAPHEDHHQAPLDFVQESITVGGKSCPATIDPATIDAWESDTQALEAWHEWRRQRERPPPD